MDPLVRKLGPEDAQEALALVRTFHASRISQAWAERLLADPTNLLLVARLEETSVGFLWAHWLPRLRLEQERLFVYEVEVAPAHRRRGIGTLLMRTALAEARARKADAFWLTNRSNAAAVAFYERLGARAENGDDLLYRLPSEEGCSSNRA